jgi:O-antigen/teichoic acid export membrane protein
MEKKTDSYKQIFKSTSIFGGVQFFNIIIAILRSKLIAVFLGPAGLGMVSLFTTTIGLITGLTNFGLGTSAVKNIAAASGSDDKDKLVKTVSVFRYLVWITGSLGFIVTLILSPLLSHLAFGNDKYILAFILLSITLLFTQISAGQNVILQGMRKIQLMAKSSLFGALIGLVVSIPLYYFFGNNGIVPAIILTSLSSLLLSWYYARKIPIPIISIDRHSLKLEGKEMLQMGFLISMSSLITLGTSYLIRVFVSNTGGIHDVGLFTAGFSIVGTYVGMVFAAMSTDYYPRLAMVSNDNKKCRDEINQQAEIAILILAPILVLFLAFIKIGVIILYSRDFLGMVNMIYWATLGVFFKAISWSIGFVFLAKSSSKVFFWNELISNVYMLGLNILGYHFFGLTGLGISFLAGYFLHFLQLYFVSNRLYNFFLERKLIVIFCFQFLAAIFCFITTFYLEEKLAYLVNFLIIVVSISYSWRELNNRIGIKQIIYSRLKGGKK